MFRTNFRLMASAMGLAVLFSATAVYGGDNDKSSAPFVHVVIIHLKKDAPADCTRIMQWPGDSPGEWIMVTPGTTS